LRNERLLNRGDGPGRVPTGCPLGGGGRRIPKGRMQSNRQGRNMKCPSFRSVLLDRRRAGGRPRTASCRMQRGPGQRRQNQWEGERSKNGEEERARLFQLHAQGVGGSKEEMVVETNTSRELGKLRVWKNALLVEGYPIEMVGERLKKLLIRGEERTGPATQNDSEKKKAGGRSRCALGVLGLGGGKKNGCLVSRGAIWGRGGGDRDVA